MTKSNNAYTLADIQGELEHIHRFLTENLGFDSGVDVKLDLKTEKRFQLHLNADDKFQSKRGYSERIGDISFWDTSEELEELFASAWAMLSKAMQRDERELRYGLAQLGDAIEGDGFQTEIGRMVAARIKAARDELSGNLLTFERKASADEQ